MHSNFIEIRLRHRYSPVNFLHIFRTPFYKNTFKELRWCCARDLFGSQIPATTGGFELQISCIGSCYLTHKAIRPNRLGGFGLPVFATLRQ